MDLSNSVYVPDPRTWILYYENLANDRRHNSYLNNSFRRTIQSGGSLTNSATRFKEPITLPQSKPREHSPIKLVTQAQQQVEHAKSEITRAVKKIKRKRSKSQSSIRKSHRQKKKKKNTKNIRRKKNKTKKKTDIGRSGKNFQNRLITKDIFHQ